MNVKIVLYLLTVGFTMLEVSGGRSQDDDQWTHFKNKYKKNFSNSTEESFRRLVWRNRREKSMRHNLDAANGLATYTMDENPFTDKTDTEVKKVLGTFVPAGVFPVPEEQTAAQRAITTPVSVDWRTSPCMPAIKDQGECGSCWAFAATNLMEFLACNKTQVQMVLSESQLINCSSGQGNYGCDGGWYAYAWNYIQTAPGQASGSALPYYPTKGQCTYDSSSMKVATVSSYTMLPAKDVTLITQTLATSGPLASAMHVIPDTFFYYSSGVYAEQSCPNTCVNSDVNHSVVLIGYGTSSEAIPFWIVRNSWGIFWGEEGYFRIQRGVNMCNIECFVSYAQV